MGRPIIGITGELEAARWGNWIREAVVSPVSYTRAVERAGGTPVILPPVPASSVPVLIAGLNGLLLTGGRDVDPSLYNEAQHDQTDLPDHRRDRFELILTRAAIEADLPFLAINRGMHILNESKLGRLLGETVQAPASHHQAINAVGTGLLAVAWTHDQVVEGVELQGHRFGLGVQWNPEDGDDARLFEALVTESEAARAQPTSRPQSDVTPRSKRAAKRHATRSLRGA